ncbi:molybdopterin oxidoreductase family protein [Zhihengliuella halotolerans]|uniref:Assimilatory nitrate reductase (NADH) alpha subunit apoprotein n=1 Tax=Zhihengliuella halotolerans TaxID=370736 RepID=A0A4Q8AF72_9MICC|nr:molybdopterin oxidoreductase family protein [Zhihengliuella halotolerans]RZU62952.1 assimilatory nitrate reductase (NADH) alpha subunit apoprotein [Zhihengliuella halotolerans]
MSTTATHCPYCALQCAMTLTPAPSSETGAGAAVEGRDFPTNNGRLCRKGFSAPELLASRQRITAPLLRGDDGEFREAGWDEVLDLLAEKISAMRAAHGPDSIAVFGAGGLTNEKAYQLGKFARLALGTRLIDYNGRFCMSSAAAAGNRSFGLDRGLPFPLTDLQQASTILLLGSNVADTMPPFVQHLEGARAAGGLIVVDPRKSATAALTDDAGGLHLQSAPGTDLELLLGLAHVILNEGLADLEYLAARTSGLAALRRTLAPWWPERTEQVTGVPAAQIRRAAHHLGNAARQARDAVVRGETPAKVFVLTGRGIEQHANGTDTTTAAINLALLLGLPGTPGGGFGTLTGQGNGQGGREHGQKSDQLPGYRKIDDPVARAHVAAAWSVPESLIPGPGIPAAQLLYSLGGSHGGTLPDGTPGPRVLMVHGSNVAVSAPDANRVIEGLRRLDFLVVADFFLSETAAEADLVLPVLQWAEEEGTMTNLEGRILRRRRGLTPPPGARDELWIMAELARRLGAPGTYSRDAREVFDELRAASAGGLADYSGIDYADLDAGRAVYWPFRASEHDDGGAAPAGAMLGTPRLFLDRFAHPDGRAKLVPVRPAPTPPGDAAGLRRVGNGGSRPDGDPSALALTVITGRLLEHYQSGAQTRRTEALAAAAPEARAEIHPAAAAQLGLEDGGWIELRNSQGVVVVRCQYSAAIRTDAVFVPFHYPGLGSVNRLVTSALDPISSMPAFKNAKVTARAVPAPERESHPDDARTGAAV